ncbi:RNA polymerase sigma-I factor [Bacillus sp. 165]|uniref:RNA polymerase sigma-I factor n=1 Tax=Bacillus sp. 165 TaxID=1529117 RepID=UPI001ADC2999|nr:RNA polymerase sigma-I factor [Bacillus sp. 165]
MFSLLFNIKRNAVEDTVARIQQGEEDSELLLAKYKPFIKKTVSSVCNRYIYEQDDEFSIGLLAFHEAVERYSYKKGASFLSFAALLIKRDVIDYLRKEMRHNLVFLKEEQQEEVEEMKVSLTEYLKEMENTERKEEILHFQTVLKSFRITFQDLVKESPKHRDSRASMMEVAVQISQREELINELFQKKKLPLKQIEDMVRVSRKTLERHRKYIIAMCIILTNDYVYIKEYIKGGVSDE